MKISKNTSAFSRYFSARFKPFTRPVFWGSLGGLLIAGVAIYQYWQHPEWIQTNSESITNSTASDRENVADVSQEDLAAAANLDNVDLLIEEIEQNQTLSNIAAENNLKKTQSPELKQEDSEFSRFQKAQQAKLDDPSKLSSATGLSSDLGIGDGNQKIMELLQPPSFSSYQSSRNSPNSSFNPTSTSQTDIIPNPVGNVYLSNRNQKLPQPPAPNPVPPNSGVENSAETNNNLAAENNSSNSVDPNAEGVVTPNGQTSQPNNQPVTVNSNLPTRFTPPSSLTQSQPGYPTGVTNPASPYATGVNPLNPSAPNNSGIPVNGTGTNANGFNSVNTGNVGVGSQPVQNPLPNSTTGFNSVNMDSAATEDSVSPDSLQNNYRSFRTVSPSYNRSTPNGYQLQPQGYSTNGLGQSNGIYGAGSVGSVNSAGVGNNTINSSPTTNAPITNNFGTPSLQPSGVLSTSEIGR
jgi:hypothetical protein